VIARLLRAWLLTAAVDGIFSSVLSLVYGSTVTMLWQSVGTTAFGNGAFGGGSALAAAGLFTHCCVALAWSTIFLIAYENSAPLRRAVAAPGGVLRVSAIYGPLIWIVMSMVVIRLATGRAPAITYRWWIQFFGHAVFVALPIVSMISRRD
jgi:hypothetical protein